MPVEIEVDLLVENEVTLPPQPHRHRRVINELVEIAQIERNKAVGLEIDVVAPKNAIQNRRHLQFGNQAPATHGTLPVAAGGVIAEEAVFDALVLETVKIGVRHHLAGAIG